MTDLGLDLFRTRGRAQAPVAAEMVRELVVADLELLEREKGSVAAPLKRIGERHHAMARMLASGMKPGQVAVAVGLHPSRVSILQADPTFKELVDFYREDVSAIYVDLHTQLSGMSLDAAEELRRRLEEAPEDMSVTALMEMLKLGADRTGHGPATKQDVRVVHDIADRLQAARARLARVVDIEKTSPDEGGDR